MMRDSWLRAFFWIGLGTSALFLLNLLSGILLPFALGAILAFFLSPAVGRLSHWHVPRTFGTLLVLTGFLTLIVLFILLLTPVFQAQVGQLISQIPGYLERARTEIDQALVLLQDHISPDDMQRLRDAMGARIADMVGTMGKIVGSVLTGGIAVANLLSLIFITPVVAFFLLRDWDDLLHTLDSWMPRQHLATIREQAGLIEETLSGFLRGQAAVCGLFGVVYAVGLTIIGLNSGLVIGLLCGILIFIPFLGGLTGGVLAVLLGFAQFEDWHKPLAILILFVVGQTLEGNLITPKLVGDRVRLHPVWIIFSLLAFGALFGFVGVLVAVPFAAVLGVLIRFALKTYLNSALYDPKNLGAKSADPS